MCTNTALVNSLECYMDDLVESFEDFVKKSLILITLGIGAIVGTLLYLLKMVTEHSQQLALQTQNTNPNENSNAADIVHNKELLSYLEQNDRQTSNETDQNYVQSSIVPNQKDDMINTTPINTNPILVSRSNIDETLIRDIGLSCSSKCSNRCRPAVTAEHSTTKITNHPKSPNCISKHHLSAPRACAKYIASRKSCCSMCCDDDDKR